MNNDIELFLLSGSPIEIPDLCKVYPLTINEIKNITTIKYNQYLSCLCIEKNEIQKIINNNEDINVFEFIIVNCIYHEDYKNLFLDALKCFIRENVGLSDIGLYIDRKEEKKFINENNFNDIKKIIKLQNCLVDTTEDNYNPVDERARKIVEKLKKDKEKRKQIKQSESQNDDNSLTLFDLVSILAAYGNNINIFNIWDLTFFQFNDQFNRMKILKDFNINVQILMNTTKPEEVEIQHWLSKIKKDD